MIHLGLPVIDAHNLTSEVVELACGRARDPDDLWLHLIDNASERPYQPHDWQGLCGRVTIHRPRQNMGFYRPLLLVRECATRADLLVLMHNDLFIFEPGWDVRMREAFVQNPRLGMLGVFGSDQVDELGGRGGGSMCNFHEADPRMQPQSAGLLVTDLRPALVLDSMLIAVREPVVDALRISESDQPCHFLDKVWPLRARAAGWDVAVLGLEVGHMGGITSTGSRFEADSKEWCERWGIDPKDGSYGMAVYLEAERRFLTEWRTGMHMMPSRLRGGHWVRG